MEGYLVEGLTGGPRASGDEPHSLPYKRTPETWSPRERG